MVRFLQKNAAWILAALTITGGALGLYVRDALADTNNRLTKVEVRQDETDRRYGEIDKKLDRIVCMHMPGCKAQ